MADLYMARQRRLAEELLPYGFSDDKYGDVPYEAVAWNGITDRVDFGFNIFVDNRLIATAECLKTGQFIVEMHVGQWLKPDKNMDADYRAAVARRAFAVSSRRNDI
jgi:hypothetical protein